MFAAAKSFLNKSTLRVGQLVNEIFTLLGISFPKDIAKVLLGRDSLRGIPDEAKVNEEGTRSEVIKKIEKHKN